MTRAAHLAQWFLLGCVASSFLSWLAMQLPQALGGLIVINLLFLLFWGGCWILDDGIIQLIRIEPITYYTALIGWGLAHLAGLGIFLWIYLPVS